MQQAYTYRYIVTVGVKIRITVLSKHFLCIWVIFMKQLKLLFYYLTLEKNTILLIFC